MNGITEEDLRDADDWMACMIASSAMSGLTVPQGIECWRQHLQDCADREAVGYVAAPSRSRRTRHYMISAGVRKPPVRETLNDRVQREVQAWHGPLGGVR